MPGIRYRKATKSIMIKANDTDVVIIAIATLPSLHERDLQKLWVAFGQLSHLIWIPIHDIVTTIGPEKTNGILFFHAFSCWVFNAFSVCDIVSVFRGKAKLSAWQTWNVCNEVSDAFTQLCKYQLILDDEALEIFEKFVVIMYDRSSCTTEVDDARLEELYARKVRPFDSIPPLKLNCFSMLNGLPIRQVWFGASQQFNSLKLRVLRTGAGYRKLTFGRSFGVPNHLLRLFVKNLQNVDVLRNVVEDVSVTNMVFDVHHGAHVHTRTNENEFCSVYVCSC